jgi:hypothetical protein
MALVVMRQAVIRDVIPRRPRGDERVEFRTDARVAVQRPESDSDFIPLGPLTAEQARAANRAEGLHASIVRPEDPDQFLTCEQPEAFPWNPSLRTAERARVFPAARAVAVIGPEEGRRHLEAHAAAETRAMEWVLPAWLRHVRWTRPGHDESLDPLQDHTCQPRRGVGTAACASVLSLEPRQGVIPTL